MANFIINLIVAAFSFILRMSYALLMKFRLMGLFLWCIGICVIYYNKETQAKYGSIVPYYMFLGLIILIGTIISMITAVVRIWNPGFQFLDLFTGKPSHMDIRYFQMVSTMEELNSAYLDKSVTYGLHRDTYGASWKDKREYRRMKREYEYLKRKMENNLSDN